jgi:hypothetical protein
MFLDRFGPLACGFQTREDEHMKKALVASLIALALLLIVAGCKKDDTQLVTPAGQANPHATVQANPAEVPAGAGHKGIVVEVLSAGEYTYIQVDEKGTKLWVATITTKVAKGDEIEFVDAAPMKNWPSKQLNRTFDSVILVAGIRNNGKK